MSDGDVSEVEVVLDGVRFYVEARQDSTEHEVGNPSAVFDGEIDKFIEAGIRLRKRRERGAD